MVIYREIDRGDLNQSRRGDRQSPDESKITNRQSTSNHESKIASH
jgi:hypothetical protein